MNSLLPTQKYNVIMHFDKVSPEWMMFLCNPIRTKMNLYHAIGPRR